jgi:hypothetical protein
MRRNTMSEYEATFEHKPELSTTPDEEDRNICPECGMYAGTKYDYCVNHR